MSAHAIQLGAVIYDQEDMPGMGWACRAGGEPFRIAGVQSLSNDTLWLVNVDYQRMNEAGLAQHAFYRGEAFLRLPVRAMLTELGLRNGEGYVAEPDHATAVLAGVFERQVRLNCRMLGMPRAHWRPPRAILRSGLREALMRPDERLDETLGEAVREANQAFTRCRPNHRGRGAAPALAFMPAPRLAHAEAVLNCPVPANTAYEHVSPPTSWEAIDQWLDAHRGPLLLRASVDHFDPEVGKLLNFGGIASVHQQTTGVGNAYQAASTRQWITGDEARVFARFARVNVHEALWWPRWAQIRHAMPPVQALFDQLDPLDHLSYSLGLFAENLWTALTLDMLAHPNDKGIAANVVAPFLRAADRLECLKYAIAVVNQNYEVMGFGAGRVGVHLGEGEPGANDEALRVAATAGLMPPFPRHGAGAMEQPPIVSEDPVYRSLIETIASDMRETFWSVDQEVVDTFAAEGEETGRPDDVAAP